VARTVSVKLMADVVDFRRNMKGAGQDVRGVTGELDKANKAGKLDHVTTAAAGLGIGLLGAAGAAVKMAADFDKQMSSVQAATHATAGDLNKMRQAALDAGADTKYSATEAAKGIEELSKAGIGTRDILGGGLTGALNLAAAGELDVGEAAETAASAMTQFKLKGGDVPHVADLLAAAAGKAQGSVHDMGAALNQSGLVAASTGLTIEDTTGTLAAFASAGLVGSDAGTSFKTMLQALQAPSGKTKDLMDELGISAYDASGNFVGITKLAGQLQTRLGTLTPELRANALAQIFGSDAVRSANVLYEQGAAGIQGWIDKTNDAGYAAETARIKTDNLAGDVERLTGSLQTLAIESGSGANSGLRVLTKTAGALVDQFGQLPPVIGSTVTVAAGLTGGALLLGVGMLKARKATSDMMDELRQVGPRGERAAAGLEKTRKGAARAAVAFVAFEAASAAVSAMQDDLNPQIDALAKGLVDFGNSGKLAGESSRLLGSDLSDLEGSFKFLADGDNSRRAAVKSLQSGFEALVPGLAGTNESLARTKERVSATDRALSQLVQGGNAGEAKAAFDRLARTLAVNGVSLEEFRKQFPAYAASLEVAGAASTGAAGKANALGNSLDGAKGAQKEFTSATDASTAAVKGQREALIDLSSRMKAEADPVFGLIEAQQKLSTAEKDAAKAIKEHGRKSTEAKEATRALALAAIDLQEKAGGVARSFDGKLTPSMYATLRAGHLTESQIKDVARQFRDAKGAADKYDGAYKAVASAPGAVQAKKDLDKAYTSANGFAGPYVANVSVKGGTKAQKELANLLIQRDAAQKGISIAEARRVYNKNNVRAATGGHIRGPGTDTSDSIDAKLSDYEYVVKARSVRKIGVRALDHINEYGELPPQYARGGLVNMRFPLDVSNMKIPSMADVMAGIGPTSGHTSDFIARVVKAAFPGIAVLSKDRPGARTLSGNVSYHSLGRAVDFSPSRPLAEWWNLHYKARTKEFISPWNDLNIHNGQRHTYTGAIYRQHNFAGGNAHDHIAMANGGVINEPVWGVGASGRSYAFGERGSETVVPGSPRYLPPSGGAAPITVVVQGGDGGELAAQNALLRGILEATQGVGGDFAAALASRSAATVRASRSLGSVSPR
jgi:TP901 family phage tail tape measure protein